MFAWLIRWLRILFSDAPADLESLIAEVDGMNVLLTWTLPEPTSTQRPIAHVRIDVRVEDVEEWTPVNDVDTSQTELTIQDVAPGVREYRGVVVDDSGTESTNPKQVTVEIPYDPPSDLETFEATLQ